MHQPNNNNNNNENVAMNTVGKKKSKEEPRQRLAAHHIRSQPHHFRTDLQVFFLKCAQGAYTETVTLDGDS